MKRDWSKTEWNLKGLLNNANKQVKDLEKKVSEANGQIKDIEKEFNDRRKEFNDQRKEFNDLKLMKLETERNLKKSINEANKRIKDLEKEVNDQKRLTKTCQAQAAKEKIDMVSGTQQGTIEFEKMKLAYGFPPFPYPIPPGVDPSMHMHMLNTDPVYKAKYDKTDWRMKRFSRSKLMVITEKKIKRP